MTKGFTFVELTIVLVFIGIIVGGVKVGQDLVHAAEKRRGFTMETVCDDDGLKEWLLECYSNQDPYYCDRGARKLFCKEKKIRINNDTQINNRISD